jgi:hypothetical protein
MSNKIRESELAVQNLKWEEDMRDQGLPDEVWKIKPSENIKGLTWRDAYFLELQSKAELEEQLAEVYEGGMQSLSMVEERNEEIAKLEQQVAKLDKKKDHWRRVHERKVIELQLRYAERSSFDLLADHYKKWTEERKLPSVSADEQNRMTTSEYEDAYLSRFIELWDVIQEEHK